MHHFQDQCPIPNPQPSPSYHYNYLVRIINPGQRSKHINKIWHGVSAKFDHTNEMKMKLIHDFEDRLPVLNDLEYGYIQRDGLKMTKTLKLCIKSLTVVMK